jgi:hypothetical protein
MEENHVETLWNPWVWCEEGQLIPNNLNNKFFSSKDKIGYITWHPAAIKEV